MNAPENRTEPVKTNGSRRPVQIMAEINRTRAEMDDTLSAIEQRLTPGQLVDQGLDYLKNSGAREYAASLGASVKTNPLPVTLAGIGIAWLMAVGNRTPQSGTTSGSMQSAKESMQSAKDSMASGIQAARERASQLTDTAGRQIDRARENWDYVLREHPLVLGAVGLAIGAVAAALAPRTSKEDELMGEARDKLMDQAKQAGGAKLDELKEQAKDTLRTAKEAAADAVKPAGTSASGTEKTEYTTEWPPTAVKR